MFFLLGSVLYSQNWMPTKKWLLGGVGCFYDVD